MTQNNLIANASEHEQLSHLLKSLMLVMDACVSEACVSAHSTADVGTKCEACLYARQAVRVTWVPRWSQEVH